MSRIGFWRAVAVPAQLAVLMVALGCESGPPTAPTMPFEALPAPPTPTLDPMGALGGTVTINGEARPIVWVELLRGGWPWAYGTTIPGGTWEWDSVPAGDGVVVIKTPPGLTCDATSRSVTVVKDQRTVVNFACVGEVKGAIQGFAANEFGTAPYVRITLTGPVSRETSTNLVGFFAFEELPPGDYVLGWCGDPVKVSVRDGAPAFAEIGC